MNDVELRKKFEDNINLVVTNFNIICPSYEDKINFLKTAVNSSDVLTSLSEANQKLLKDAMEAFIDSARVTETRRMQQAMLMPLLGKMFKDTPFNEMNEYFKKENKEFSLFCMMYTTFRYEESLRKHGEDHHKDILIALDKYVNGLINL